MMNTLKGTYWQRKDSEHWLLVSPDIGLMAEIYKSKFGRYYCWLGRVSPNTEPHLASNVVEVKRLSWELSLMMEKVVSFIKERDKCYN